MRKQQPRLVLLLRVALAFLCSLGAASAWALNEASQTFTLDGQLFLPGATQSLLDTNATLKIQILNPAGTCLLYEEEQSVNTATTDGRFTIYVGSAVGATKRTVNDPGRTMAQIFQNSVPISANSVPGQTCAGSSYTPLAGAVRYFRITVTPSTTGIPNVLSPDIALDSVPQAIVAQSLQGIERSQVLQVNNSGSTVLTQGNLEALFTTPAYTNLQSILGGNFMKTDASGASLPSYAADPAGVSTGDIWFDTTTNEIKYKTAGGVQAVGASGGGISSLTVGSSMSINGTVAGTISGSGTIDLSNTGVAAGTYAKVTVDVKGRVTAGSVSLSESDIPTLSSAGKVSGNAITSGTISGSAGINTSGNLVTTGTVSALTAQATNLRIYNGTNYVQFAAPALAGIVNFTLPDNDGNAGDVLTSNGSGVLSWTPASSTLAGDVSGPSGANSVDKIKGKAITAGSVSGQIMIYDGTAWTNNVMSGDATLAHNGIFTLNKVPVSKGGTNSTTFGNNRIIASNGTGSAFVDFTCPLNQVITFDVSGNAACANVSSLITALVNGGNSTGGTMSVGSNDNHALQFKTNNTIAMTISQSGYVGIGTATPTGILDVRGGTVTSGNGSDINIIGQTTTAGGSNGGNINITGGDGTNYGGSVTIAGGGYGYARSSIVLGGGGWLSNDVTISAGDNNSNGAPGKVTITTGASANNGGGPLILTTGAGYNNKSGHIYIASGNPGANGAGDVLLGVTSSGVARGKVGINTSTPSTALDVSGAVNYVGIAAPAVSPASEGRIYFDRTANKFKVSENGGAYTNMGTVGGSGTTNAVPKFTASGTVGDSAITDNGTVITTTRAVASVTNNIATGAVVNLATSNTHTLASVGGAAITVSGQQDGGMYTIIVEDTTSRTYTFTGCTNSYFKPVNAPTTASSRTVYGLMTIKKGANWDCYITWSSGFQ